MAFYKRFEENVLNPKHKKLTWYNRNYFYISTLLIIGLLCLSFFVLKDKIEWLVEQSIYWNMFFRAFRHVNLNQLIGCIATFAVVSLFLERHFGSIKYFAFVMLSVIPSSLFTFAFSGCWNWMGFSGVNYFLYAIFLILITFDFKNYFIGKARWWFPLFILVVILFMICGHAELHDKAQLQFDWFKDFVENVGHWASFAAGGVVGLIASMFSIKKKRKAKPVLKSGKMVTPPAKNNVFSKKKSNKK